MTQAQVYEKLEQVFGELDKKYAENARRAGTDYTPRLAEDHYFYEKWLERMTERSYNVICMIEDGMSVGEIVRHYPTPVPQNRRDWATTPAEYMYGGTTHTPPIVPPARSGSSRSPFARRRETTERPSTRRTSASSSHTTGETTAPRRERRERRTREPHFTDPIWDAGKGIYRKICTLIIFAAVGLFIFCYCFGSLGKPNTDEWAPAGLAVGLFVAGLPNFLQALAICFGSSLAYKHDTYTVTTYADGHKEYDDNWASDFAVTIFGKILILLLTPFVGWLITPFKYFRLRRQYHNLAGEHYKDLPFLRKIAFPTLLGIAWFFVCITMAGAMAGM